MRLPRILVLNSYCAQAAPRAGATRSSSRAGTTTPRSTTTRPSGSGLTKRESYRVGLEAGLTIGLAPTLWGWPVWGDEWEFSVISYIAFS